MILIQGYEYILEVVSGLKTIITESYLSGNITWENTVNYRDLNEDYLHDLCINTIQVLILIENTQNSVQLCKEINYFKLNYGKQISFVNTNIINGFSNNIYISTFKSYIPFTLEFSFKLLTNQTNLKD